MANGIVTHGADFVVVASAKDETSSSVAMAPSGAFDIVYHVSASSTDDDILLNRYSSSGALLASNVGVARGPARERKLDIAMDSAGNAVVVYQTFNGFGDFDVKARRVSIGGSVGSEIIARASGDDEFNPSVALAPTGGSFVVA